MEDEELKKYVADEASQYIPFDIDDVYLDFQRLPARNPDSERMIYCWLPQRKRQ